MLNMCNIILGLSVLFDWLDVGGAGGLVTFFNTWEAEKNSWVVVFRGNQYPLVDTNMVWVNSRTLPVSALPGLGR